MKSPLIQLQAHRMVIRLTFVFVFIFLGLFPSSLFGEQKFFDHLRVGIEERKLTIRRESVTNSDENFRLKLDGDALREKGVFSIHQVGRWCRDIHTPKMGTVRIVVEVLKNNFDNVGRDYLPIFLTMIVKGNVVFDRAHYNHKNALKKIVVNSDDEQVEFYRETGTPVIRKYEFRSKFSKDPRVTDLFLRNPRGESKCSKAEWANYIGPADWDFAFKSIKFINDEVKINDLAMHQLMEIYIIMKSTPNLRIEIQGHCDERGSNNENILLGQTRADFIKKYLMSLGVESERMSTISYGEETPTCMQSNEECWKMNNQVKFLTSK